jgi:hypothetical protein
MFAVTIGGCADSAVDADVSNSTGPDALGATADTGNFGIDDSSAGNDDTSIPGSDAGTLDTTAPSTAGPRPPYSNPWPLALATGNQHGFPEERLTLDCDPSQFATMSPALLRASSSTVVLGMLRAIDIPEQDLIETTTCEGDRWDGLQLTVLVEESTGSFGPAPGEEVEFRIPSDQLRAWARRPRWDAASQTARWSDWNTEFAPAVPMVDGRVLIAANAVTPLRSDEVWLQPTLLFSISEAGDVIAQSDQRGACRSRLQGAEGVAVNDGPVQDLWQQIAFDELSDQERGRADLFDPSVAYQSAATWVECAE